jgi:hypothetical protein
MEDENRNDRDKKLDGIRDRINNPAREKKIDFSKIAKYSLITAGILTVPAILLFRDFITKRQNYPERNVLFRSSNTTYLAGVRGKEETKHVDEESINKFYSGGGGESKVGTYLMETTREKRGDIEYYNMDNSQKIRIASATQKPEKFQAGVRIGGSLNFREQFAEIVLGSNSKAAQKYMVYKFAPERGLREKDVDVIENSDGSRQMVNRLTEYRTFPLGWMFGKENYLAGTSLENYLSTPENQVLFKEFLGKVRILDSPEAVNKSRREKMAYDILDLEEEIKHQTTYSTFEDGLFKIFPQGGTLYLGERPGSLERAKNFLGFGRDRHKRLVVKNHWDLLPGFYPLINGINFGQGDNKLYPFDKYNNGGYTLVDKFGKLAEIDIEDFVLFYGQDVLYSYYLDLNGDGKLDRKNELIGQVICRTTHDERLELKKLAKGKVPPSDLTLTLNYSFMAPDNDIEKGMKYFKLCAYMESMIPDQIKRGLGKHSLLGFINDQRSDLMLFNELNLQNMSRALTQESTLVAEYDIIRVLNAARRPYAQELAKTYRIDDYFKGQYQKSDLLHQKANIGPLDELSPFSKLALGVFGIGAAGAFYLRSRKKAPKKKISLDYNNA